MITSLSTSESTAPPTEWPYSAAAEEVRLACEALIPVLRERAQQNEEQRGIDPDTMAALRATGAFSISNPRKWGGLALMPSEQARIIQTVARGDAGIAWNVALGSLHAQSVTRASEQFQEEVFSKGAGPVYAGSGPNPAATVRRVEGGWMVTGRWDYASTSQYAAWAMANVLIDGPEGSKVPLAVFAPMQKEWLLDNWDVMGLSSSNSQSFEITEEEFIPDHRTGITPHILAGGPPALAEEEPLYGLHMPVFAQLAGLANALGAFSAIVDEWQEATTTRRVAHPDFVTQADNPITHLKLGEYRAFLAAGQAVLDKLTAFADELVISRRQPTEGELAESSAMSNYVLYQVAERALDVLRDSSTTVIKRSNPIQRALRDIIVMNMHAASNRDRSYEGFGRFLYDLAPLGFVVPGPPPASAAAAAEPAPVA